jgi:hypothetical protein
VQKKYFEGTLPSLFWEPTPQLQQSTALQNEPPTLLPTLITLVAALNRVDFKEISSSLHPSDFWKIGVLWSTVSMFNQ